MGKQKALVTVILDKSDSMRNIVPQTISGLNEYIEGLKGSEDDIRFSLVTFSSPRSVYGSAGEPKLDRVIITEDVKTMRKLEDADMRCNGWTPLFYAIKETVQAVERSLGERRDVKPVIVIQTDGQENCSPNVSVNDVKALISNKEALGWEFVFLGCGINAYEQGVQFGLTTDKIISYGREVEHSSAVFRAAAMSTSNYLETGASMAFSADQKTAAGDAYFEKKKGG